MLFAYKVQVLALISTTLPSSLITETPESVATAIVGTGRSVSGLIGALGRVVMSIAFIDLLTSAPGNSQLTPLSIDPYSFLLEMLLPP